MSLKYNKENQSLKIYSIDLLSSRVSYAFLSKQNLNRYNNIWKKYMCSWLVLRTRENTYGKCGSTIKIDSEQQRRKIVTDGQTTVEGCGPRRTADWGLKRVSTYQAAPPHHLRWFRLCYSAWCRSRCLTYAVWKTQIRIV